MRDAQRRSARTMVVMTLRATVFYRLFRHPFGDSCGHPFYRHRRFRCCRNVGSAGRAERSARGGESKKNTEHIAFCRLDACGNVRLSTALAPFYVSNLGTFAGWCDVFRRVRQESSDTTQTSVTTVSQIARHSTANGDRQCAEIMTILLCLF